MNAFSAGGEHRPYGGTGYQDEFFGSLQQLSGGRRVLVAYTETLTPTESSLIMKRHFRHLLATLAFGFSALALQAGEAGSVELGQFKPTEGCQYVEVNLHAPLLKFAAAFVAKDEPEVAELIRGLKRVRVHVVGYNESTRSDTTDRVAGLREELTAQGWTKIVTVQQGAKDEDVAIYVKMADDESVDGIVVTVIDAHKDEAVVVNVVGNIKPEQLAALGEELHIEPLAHLRATSDRKRS